MSNFYADTIQALRSILVSLPGSPPLPLPMADFYAETLQLLGLIQQTVANFPTLIDDAINPIQAQVAGLAPSILLYTFSQSSVYNSNNINLGSYEKLNNSDNTIGAGTLSAAATLTPQWLQADLGSVRSVASCVVAAGPIAGGFNNSSSYLNGSQVQISMDALTWIPVAVVSGSTDSPLTFDPALPNLPYPIPIVINRPARYVRLWKNSTWLGATQFTILGW